MQHCSAALPKALEEISTRIDPGAAACQGAAPPRQCEQNMNTTPPALATSPAALLLSDASQGLLSSHDQEEHEHALPDPLEHNKMCK